MSNTKPNTVLKKHFEKYPVYGLKWEDVNNATGNVALSIESGGNKLRVTALRTGTADGYVDVHGQLLSIGTCRWHTLGHADLPILNRLILAAEYNTFNSQHVGDIKTVLLTDQSSRNDSDIAKETTDV